MCEHLTTPHTNTQDLAVVSQEMVWQVMDFFASLQNVMLSLLTVVALSPSVLVIVTPVLLYLYFLQKSFRVAKRRILRLRKEAGSPISTSFAETFRGLSTVRAFENEHLFSHTMRARVLRGMSARLANGGAGVWLQIRLSLASTLIFGAIIVAAAVSHLFQWNINLIPFGTTRFGIGHMTVSAAAVATAVNQGSSLAWVVNFIIANLNNVEDCFVSWERLASYVDLPAESGYEMTTAAGTKLDKYGVVGVPSEERRQEFVDWPSEGESAEELDAPSNSIRRLALTLRLLSLSLFPLSLPLSSPLQAASHSTTCSCGTPTRCPMYWRTSTLPSSLVSGSVSSEPAVRGRVLSSRCSFASVTRTRRVEQSRTTIRSQPLR